MTGQARQAAMAQPCEPVEMRIRRFARQARKRLRKLVRGSKPLTDLLYSFPAAAFVLAAGKRTPEQTAEALALVKAGQSLAAVAFALDLPLWTRRLPPEAFTEPLGTLPGSDDFCRKIANRLPTDVVAAPLWLRSVAFSAEACEESFALWIAGRALMTNDDGGHMPILPLAAFAWFSRRKEMAAHRLIPRPWHKYMSFYQAVWETRCWLERVLIEHLLEASSIGGGWDKERRSCGYRFVPLRSADDLREEGERMRNCVGTYADKVASGQSLIYSVRRGAMRLATLEVVMAARGYARIAQLYAAENSSPREDMRRAAHAWIGKRSKYPAIAANDFGQLPIRASRWAEIWQPYCTAKPQFAACLLAAPAKGLQRLHADVRLLDQWHECRS